ncbi:transposase zinc-binding domain-containing protein [Pseudomonas asuensis]
MESVNKMLTGGTSILGVKHYSCGNEHCSHIKDLCNTCHCRPVRPAAKATDQWIAVQSNRLPDCPWYPLVFTLPDTLWPLFFLVCGVLRQSGSRSQPWGFGPVIRGRQADSPGTQALRATTQNL